MKFSVISVCWNSAETLSTTMQSLQEQGYQDYEWIVVDGASTDHTMVIVNQFKGPLGAVVSEKDTGIYSAMNKGVSLARGEYLYFLNSDDKFSDSSVLADIADVLATTPAIDLLYGSVVYQQPNGRMLRSFEHIDRQTLPYEDLCHQAVFARRSLFEEIGGFNERFRTNADYDWLLRVFNAGKRTRYIDRTVAIFKTGGAHMQNITVAIAERSAVRLQYISMPALWWGDLRRRFRHRLHLLQHGRRPGQAKLDVDQNI